MQPSQLDQIDDAIQVLIDDMEAKGHRGFISYCIQVDDGQEVYESQLISTSAKPSHYFLALKSWVNMIYKHFNSAGM